MGVQMKGRCGQLARGRPINHTKQRVSDQGSDKNPALSTHSRAVQELVQGHLPGKQSLRKESRGV